MKCILYLNCFILLQISDCFKNFGIDNNDTSLLVAEIHEENESKIAEISALIEGESSSLSKLSHLCDTQLIHKVTDTEFNFWFLANE